MVAINAKEICRFEVRALKRFLCKALLRLDFVRIPRLRFLLTLEDKISGKGHFIDDSSEYIEDITRWREDMNFMFEWQQQYLTSERSERVRYCSCHENIEFISSSHRVMFFLLYGD